MVQSKKKVDRKIKLRLVPLIITISLLVIESCNKEAENPIPITTLPSTLCHPFISFGYTEKTSYFPGDKMKAYIQSLKNVDLCRLDVYTINNEIAFSVASDLNVQEISTNDPSVNGYGYNLAADIQIPTNLKSGIYLIEKKIPFIVKSASPVDLTIVYPSNTVNAYSRSGGKSLYDRIDRPWQVSFQRPMEIQGNAHAGLKWFATLTNYNIGYVSDEDMDTYASIQNSNMLVIVGHSEYWTRKARKNFDLFIELGNDAIILSGNTMWWQVRYSDDHQMICYKYSPDPVPDPLLKTMEWINSTLQYSIISSIGADFPRGGYGLLIDNGWDGYKVVNDASPLLEGLNLKKGDVVSFPTGEYDGAPILNFTADGYPELDKAALNFQQVELVGFDKGSRAGKETIGTFIVFKKTISSGIVVNAASNDWCSERGIGGVHGDQLKKITLNSIDKLLYHKPLFSN